MPGLTLQQLQKMGAQPIQRVGGSGLTAEQLKSQGATPAPAPVAKAPSNKTSPFTVFESKPTDTALTAGAKTLGNVPGSALGFAKGVAEFLNPMTTVRTAQELGTSLGEASQEKYGPGFNLAAETVKGLPKAAYEVLVPQFFQHLFAGDTEGAQKIITEDPVGQLGPVLLTLRGVAEKSGIGPQFDQVMTKATDIATKPITVPAKAAADLTTNTLGITTGAGGEAVRTAFKGGSDFTEAMRGKTPMQTVLQESQDAVSRLRDMRSQEYQTKLADVKLNTDNLNIAPIFETLNRNLKSFNVKPLNGEITPESFSRSVLQNDVPSQQIFKTIYDNLKSYGTQAGDRTPIALDTLKRSLGDLYSPNSSVRSFVQSMRTEVSGLLKKNVPGYEEMTKGYEQYSSLLNDVKSSLSVGGKAGPEAAIKKLSGAMKQNNELRLEVLKDLEQKTGINLRDKIAGAALNDKIPRGLIGKGIDAVALYSIFRGMFSPEVFATLIASSPRLVGELMNALGIASRGVWKVLKPLNEAPMIILESALGKKTPIDKLKLGLSIEDVSKNQSNSSRSQSQNPNSSNTTARNTKMGTNASDSMKKNIPLFDEKIKGSKLIHREDLYEMRDFTDYVNHSYMPKNFVALEIAARRIAERYGINPNVSNRVLSNTFGKILDAQLKLKKDGTAQ